ncbi:hypothetical protein BO79DRAFT_272517 [Aspergillus costaricaensis CBS 115574]|uniref:Uncharacterized protein n=1 Tax=Aspergillus costaricaensis CBS 115574 TaxID=1448317 RepID=A0ACD1ISN9_9EURO|nr:hypothetical protein BO79DRAFT_272517 [Aspergillus costaricaensis CBS 115574]RAK93125.1 hypothetical protein BO79DRAFT_272517 [Aspergillus costaricaensis CBS 115574]
MDAILDFAADLTDRLAIDQKKRHLGLDVKSMAQLDQQLNDLPLLIASPSSSTRRRFDQEGTTLWNTCIQLMTVYRDRKEEVALVCKVKVFAYAMLEYAAPYRGTGSNRALETAFSIVSTCMENGYLDLSQKIIETAAIRLDKLEKSGSDIEDSKFQQYTIEYYMLRVYLAWLQGRLDIAEHLFSKIPVSDNGRGQERVMDICYKIGNCALSRKQHDVSVKWLERALRAFRAGLRLDTKEPSGFLAKAMDVLKIHYGGMFPIQIIQLELLSKEELDENVFSQGH